MTTDKPSKDELAAMLLQLDEQQLALVFATWTARRIDPDRAELEALVGDAAATTDWLRAHLWLDPVDPVFKLGPLARLALQEDQRRAATLDRLQKYAGLNMGSKN